MSSPGQPWHLMSAEALARAGMLDRYIAPFAYATAPPAVAWLPVPIRRRLVSELSRRFVSELVADVSIRRGSFLDALVVLATRAGLQPDAVGQLHGLRSIAFDRQVTRLMRPGPNALLASHGAALSSLRRARQLGMTSYLDFPVAHHRFAEQLLQEEARLEPRFAETLQFHRLPRGVVSRLDQEIGDADYVVVGSTFVRHTFEQAGIRSSKVLVIPYGVDTELFCPQRQPRSSDGFRVLFVGQITQRKGVSYLFEAFRRAAIPRSELMVVGGICGSDRAWRHLPGVRHVSPVPRWQLPALYRSADVFVMPSLVEGFCLTALEAMACGVPVILSEHTGTEEILTGREGFRVAIRDADAIAECLVQLDLNADAREEMASAAHERAQLFSWQLFGQRIAETLRGAAEVPQ